MENKIKAIEFGIKLEKAKIERLTAQLENATLCDRIGLEKEINIANMIIDNSEERIDILNLVW